MTDERNKWQYLCRRSIMKHMKPYFPNENILHTEKAWWIKNLFSVKTGWLILTNKRIAFIENRPSSAQRILIDPTAASKGISAPSLSFDLPKEDWLEVTTEKRLKQIGIRTRLGKFFKLRTQNIDQLVAKI